MAATVALVGDGVTLLLGLLQHLGTISSLIANANAQGRESFTPDEWSSIMQAADAARAHLVASLAASALTGPTSSSSTPATPTGAG